MTDNAGEAKPGRSIFGIRIKYEENIFGILAFIISFATLIFNLVDYARAEVKLMPMDRITVYFHGYPSGEYVKLVLPVIFANTGRPAAEAIIARHSVSFSLPGIAGSECAARVAQNYRTNNSLNHDVFELADGELFRVGPDATTKMINVRPGPLRTTFFTKPGEVNAEEVIFSSATRTGFLRREFFECWVLNAQLGEFIYTAEPEHGGAAYTARCVVDFTPWRENMMDKPRNTIAFPCADRR